MRNLLLAYFICANINLAIFTKDDKGSRDDDKDDGVHYLKDNQGSSNNLEQSESSCWMTLNTPQLFDAMEAIDDRYNETRNSVQKALMERNFDQTMIQGLVDSRGAALREVHKLVHKGAVIPSGLHLGGQCMLRMVDSLMFFHRMKLRNHTHFRVTDLHNDITNLMMTATLSLYDLHLQGAYERTLTDTDPSVLIYAPSFGEVEFLLRNVVYTMEGRYRINDSRLTIELVTSTVTVHEVLMTYVTQAIESASISIGPENMGDFLRRLKNDLDMWMKEYFNDYLIYVNLARIDNIKELEKYDKEKTIALQEYMDASIALIKARVQKLNAQIINIPNFTLKSIHGLQIRLFDGTLHGLDSMYRRSVPTGVKFLQLRKVDAIVGFSALKVVYKYEAIIPTGVPPLSGELTMTANEAAAYLGLLAIKDPDTVDLDIYFLDEMKPGSLTVEGPANTLISNFKHLLEHEILTLMSASLIHGIEMLQSLPHCAPFVPGQLVTKKPPEQDYTIIKLLNISDTKQDKKVLNHHDSTDDDVDESLSSLSDDDNDDDSNSKEYSARKNNPSKALFGRSKNKKKTKKYTTAKISKKISNKNIEDTRNITKRNYT